MNNQFEDAMAARSDAELIRIVQEQRDDYEKEALEAAEAEFKRRNLSATQIREATLENEFLREVESEKAHAKLPNDMKALAFLFAGWMLLLFAGSYKADRYDRKARELTRWTLYRFGFYTAIGNLVNLL